MLNGDPPLMRSLITPFKLAPLIQEENYTATSFFLEEAPQSKTLKKDYKPKFRKESIADLKSTDK